MSSLPFSVEPTDIAIILVSLAACAYCFVLNRRLKALQNTKDGLGATIVAMSKSIAAMNASTQDTRTHVSEMTLRLARQLEDANQMCARLEALQAKLEKTQSDAVERVTSTQAELGTMLRIILDESKSRILEITSMMHDLRVLTDEVQATTAPALQAAHVRQKAMTGTR
ncbi:MAG: hypothetical protein KDA53_15535 [Hyphomonas sp.]|nr:hypothetical protein [Hyphomonas sp.]